MRIYVNRPLIWPFGCMSNVHRIGYHIPKSMRFKLLRVHKFVRSKQFIMISPCRPMMINGYIFSNYIRDIFLMNLCLIRSMSYKSNYNVLLIGQQQKEHDLRWLPYHTRRPATVGTIIYCLLKKTTSCRCNKYRVY